MASTLSLRRRGHVERKVLRLIRGDSRAGPAASTMRRTDGRGGPDAAPTPDQLALFADLRDRATRYGLHIQAPDNSYVGADELRLLGWLAERQRVAGWSSAIHADEALTRAVVRCAAMLTAAGMRLPPGTVYTARLHRLVAPPETNRASAP
ncbi:MAG: hypothetical protein WCY29_10190 [Novosphingobium sp.]